MWPWQDLGASWTFVATNVNQYDWAETIPATFFWVQGEAQLSLFTTLDSSYPSTRNTHTPILLSSPSPCRVSSVRRNWCKTWVSLLLAHIFLLLINSGLFLSNSFRSSHAHYLQTPDAPPSEKGSDNYECMREFYRTTDMGCDSLLVAISETS